MTPGACWRLVWVGAIGSDAAATPPLSFRQWQASQERRVHFADDLRCTRCDLVVLRGGSRNKQGLPQQGVERIEELRFAHGVDVVLTLVLGFLQLLHGLVHLMRSLGTCRSLVLRCVCVMETEGKSIQRCCSLLHCFVKKVRVSATFSAPTFSIEFSAFRTSPDLSSAFQHVVGARHRELSRSILQRHRERHKYSQVAVGSDD